MGASLGGPSKASLFCSVLGTHRVAQLCTPNLSVDGTLSLFIYCLQVVLYPVTMATDCILL